MTANSFAAIGVTFFNIEFTESVRRIDMLGKQGISSGLIAFSSSHINS